VSESGAFVFAPICQRASASAVEAIDLEGIPDEIDLLSVVAVGASAATN
jgi:hypothetical protein